MSTRECLATTLGGVLLVNAVPHGTAALLRRPFPTPFADPPGIGLSGTGENAAWSTANLVVGGLLVGRRRWEERSRSEIVTATVAAIGMVGYLTWHFGVSAPERRR